MGLPHRWRVVLGIWLGAIVCRSSAADWPTFRGDAQRSAFYPEFPSGELELSWRKELWRELTGPRAEVIVSNGLAFLGTYAGNLYAWDAVDGTERWKVTTEGPIGHSVAVADGLVVFGSMDGKLRAVEAATGKLRWEFSDSTGFWTAPLIVGNTVFVGSRVGLLHAVKLNDGNLLWVAPIGRLPTTVSASEDGKDVIVAGGNTVNCVRAATGAARWETRRLAGVGTRDYAPVVTGDLVFVTTSPADDFHSVLNGHEEMLTRRTGFIGKDKRYIPGSADDVVVEQDFVVNHLKEHPEERTFHAFKVSDGSEPWIAPILYTGGLHNPPSPPCVNRQTGEIFVQLRSAYGSWDGGGEVRSFTCFGKLDPATGRVDLLNPNYPSKEADRPAGAKDRPWMAFNYIGDETQTLSCSPGRLFSNHQGYLGMLDLRSGFTERLFGKRDTYAGFYGPGTFGWEDQGGVAKARASRQPFGIVNEWHGPAKGVASVANGRVYYHSGAQVLCFAPKK